MRARLEFKAQDLWIGAFWKVSEGHFSDSIPMVDLWICLIPMCPIHLWWNLKRASAHAT